MRILCPSKTFLIGEYAVLTGNSAILLSTPPYFSWDSDGFYDPYDRLGGFGASGAHFVIKAKQQGMVDVWKVLDSYKKQGFSGSGADVVSQWMGGVTHFSHKKNIIENILWPFENLYVGLIHTGNKLNTQEHLDRLSQKNFDNLGYIAEQCYDSVIHKNQNLFIKAILDYAETLDKLNLVADTTKIVINKLNQLNNKDNKIVLAAKGCGAMGADVVLVVIEKNAKEALEDFCQTENLNLIYCDNQFADGVKQYD